MTAIVRRLAAFALLVAAGIAAPGSAEAQKALVYCPSADATGCAAIGNALSAHGSFPGGVDRAFDGSGGTVDLGSVDLSGYAVFVVPSLATDGGSDPYAVVRSEAVASRLRAAFTGRVAVWSGTPDLGTSNLDKKQALIRNLARWAVADAAAGRAGGIVALQDASPEALARYGWLAQISSVSIASDAAVTEAFANVEARTATGREILDWNGLQLGYTNMASGALIPPAGASVEATGGRTTGAVLVTFAGAVGGEPIATITTDKQDYEPGETVTITGSGWLPGETVSMRLHEEPVVHGDRTLTAVADNAGNILNNAFHPEEHDLGVRFVLTATGGTSGRTAQTTFTDNRTINSATVNGAATTSVAPGAAITVSINVTTTSVGGGGENWFSTSHRIELATPPNTGSTVCVDVPNPDVVTVGTFTRTFVVTAPTTPGTYNLALIAYRTALCANNPSNPFQLTNAITVVAPTPTVDAAGPYSGNEGSPVSLSGATASGGAAPLSYKWTYVADAGVDAGATCSFSPDDTSLNPSVTCTDDGTFTLTLTVTGSNGQSASDNATLTLANVAPTANAGGPYSGAEGSAIALSGDGDDAGNNDDAGLTYLWSVTTTGIDAGGACTIASATSKNTTVTCTDDGSFTVSLTASDGDGGTSSASTATLTVANSAPVASAGPDYAGDEGSAVQLNGSATDAGSNDAITYLWTVNAAGLGGGSCSFDDATKKDAKVTCTDNGTATLTLTATDDDGGSHADAATLTLSNVGPVANAGPDYTGNEGSAVQLNGSVSDAGSNDTHTWSWQYVGGPGAFDPGASCSFSSASAEDPTITCTDDGTVELTLTVTDDDGESGTDEATLTLANVNPVAEAAGPYSGDEGSAIQLNGSATDAGTNDQLSYKWTVNTGGIDAGGACSFDDDTKKDAKVTCTDDGSFTLTLKATDDDGGEDTDIATLTVANATPVANAGGPYSGVEGTTVALTGTEGDAGGNDALTRQWTYSGGTGTCSITNATALNASISCTDNGTYQVTLTVTDDDLASHASTVSLTLSNAAPVLSAINAPLAPVNVNTAVTVSATFTDQGTGDTHTGQIDWGDGTTAAVITEANGSGTASGTHAYATPGVYTVRMTVTDDDGAVSNESVYQYIVVFDPSAGFVTGGGWLNSTPGMYRVNPAAQGKANFGFVSKYQKGAVVPTGNTEFQFHAGDLNFKSSVYQWLVVQGQTKASYKGSGTINGAGDYGFLLAVIDGGSTGDRFRIKIWDKSANDAVVYDNLLADAGDDALPTTGIMGGNIVVHAK